MSEGLDWLSELPSRQHDRLVALLEPRETEEFPYHWALFARAAQLPPGGDWRVWAICAGRGFGKTRAGAEWVRAIAESHPRARIALVGASLAEARAVMVEGESGIMACCRPDRQPLFDSSLHRVRFPNGAIAQLYSAANPEGLRGPQHSHAWCDEVGKWPIANERATRCWDNLMLGLRQGSNPRAVVTTTPRAVPLARRLLGSPHAAGVVVSRGSTYDNCGNLPLRFLDAIDHEYAGTQLARQELAGELLTDIEGGLWTRDLLEQGRETALTTELTRIVVAVDPPASAEGDACGIVVAGLGADGIARVLADCSRERCSPEGWARAVADAALAWRADRVIAEANNGGAMVESVLRAAGSALPIKLVRASHGKAARAEPVAALYEAARVKHCGVFGQLEDQLCGLLVGGQYAGPGRSPDRADALVWALSELMLTPARRPSIRIL